MNDEIGKLYEMIEDLDVAMMTTRRRDGHLVSRAMSTQKAVPGSDLWFVTSNATHKLDELIEDPHVNLAYYKDRTREWISVSGIATVTQDRVIIAQLFSEDWKMWFGRDGDSRHGTPDDPRIVLIGVQVHSAMFLEVDKPQPVVLYEMVKGWISGQEPDIGKMHHVAPH